MAEKAIDPVCGMEVEPTTDAPTFVHEGVTYFFCCDHCRERFSTDPSQFLEDHGSETGTDDHSDHGATYTCPMHPEVRQVGPGSCPDCGMALEPVTVQAPRQRTEFSSTMRYSLAPRTLVDDRHRPTTTGRAPSLASEPRT